MKIKLSGGPLEGRSYDVPSGAHTITPADKSGAYVIVDGEARWEPAAVAQAVAGDAEPTGFARAIVKAADGLRVLVVARKRKDAAELVRSAADAVERSGSVESIRRANGNERIRFHGGGFLLPIGLNSGAGSRGIAADVLYLVDLAEDDPTLAADVLPSLSASTVGTVVVHDGRSL
ncbi:hypothetical protein A9Z40_03060 [Microbacterium arborescens]|uniref:Uncharacterized protein n=1 Tax=Microbacterium arborescens TaxID=33883 RepID=A0ABX2WI90_9MICO|nr:hypothetical protein [Microbacterium arborescens]OAZ40935.1 hypothetical protein A9Z40_03060 [Microbacterium arborescens]